MIGGDPAEAIGCAARPERHHHTHRPVRPILGFADGRSERKSRNNNGRQTDGLDALPSPASHLPPRAAVCYHSVKQPVAQRQGNRGEAAWQAKIWKANMTSHGGLFS